jgi:hypothetical protein
VNWGRTRPNRGLDGLIGAEEGRNSPRSGRGAPQTEGPRNWGDARWASALRSLGDASWGCCAGGGWSGEPVTTAAGGGRSGLGAAWGSQHLLLLVTEY